MPSKLDPVSQFFLGGSAAVGFTGVALSTRMVMTTDCPISEAVVVETSEGVPQTLVDANALRCEQAQNLGTFYGGMFLFMALVCTGVFFASWLPGTPRASGASRLKKPVASNKGAGGEALVTTESAAVSSEPDKVVLEKRPQIERVENQDRKGIKIPNPLEKTS